MRATCSSTRAACSGMEVALRRLCGLQDAHSRRGGGVRQCEGWVQRRKGGVALALLRRCCGVEAALQQPDLVESRIARITLRQIRRIVPNREARSKIPKREPRQNLL